MRLIDADFEVAHWESALIDPTPDVAEKDRRTAPYIIDALKMAGTVKDAVEVVRCHKCIHWDEDTVRQNSNDATWWNEAVCRKYSDDMLEVWKDADWFCADGERKTDG